MKLGDVGLHGITADPPTAACSEAKVFVSTNTFAVAGTDNTKLTYYNHINYKFIPL